MTRIDVTIRVVCLFMMILSVSTVVTANEGAPANTRILLNDHEPNWLLYTKDDDDQPFLDFKLSMEYPLLHSTLNKLVTWKRFPSWLKRTCKNRFANECYPYFAFTGRFGQYIEQRESSPVIAKRFNPKLFVRFKKSNAPDYLDLEYAHESNGQRVETAEAWTAMADSLEQDYHGKREYANDYISRGWDYIGVTGKYRFKDLDDGFAGKVTSYLSLRHYVGGLLQGDIEEYNDWESEREITKRQQVSGISLTTKLENKTRVMLDDWFTGYKLALIYQTGLQDTFEYNTVRVEVLTKFADLPVILRISKGYESDLAQYYKRVGTISLGLELRTF